jgi:hypothetical protein
LTVNAEDSRMGFPLSAEERSCSAHHLENLISLASRAAELFERSKTEQKRQLIAFDADVSMLEIAGF